MLLTKKIVNTIYRENLLRTINEEVFPIARYYRVQVNDHMLADIFLNTVLVEAL